MQVRPLQRHIMRTPIEEGGDGKWYIQYGDHAYVTFGREFSIQRYDDGWRIYPWAAESTVASHISMTGLFKARFSRRRDAVSALEEALEGIE